MGDIMEIVVMVAMVSAALCGSAHAWSDEGHKIACEVAYRLAASDTRAAIRKLIHNDQEYDTSREACVYPDHPRKRASEHFINLPRTPKV
jgi:hypothetical protein